MTWIHQPGERFSRYVVVHSAKISGNELARAEELLEAGQVIDFIPIIFLDKSLDTPELRSRIRAEAVRREPPAQ
jgi:hypothetical protein